MVTTGSVEQMYWQDAQSRHTTPAPSPAVSMDGTVPYQKTTVSLGGSINNPIFVQQSVSEKNGNPKDKRDRSPSATSHQAPGVRNEKFDKYYHKIFGCKKTIPFDILSISYILNYIYFTPVTLRMRRYFRPRKDGSMQASSEALRMWRTESGRFLDLILGHN